MEASLDPHRDGIPARSRAVSRVQVYSTRWCGYCVRAKALLEGKGIAYEEILLDDDPAFRQRLQELTGGWTVPQIVIDGTPIGGYTELWRLDKSGQLDARLAA
jgi:glutaredoxin 3